MTTFTLPALALLCLAWAPALGPPQARPAVLSLQEIKLRTDRAAGSIEALSHFDNYIRANYKDSVETDLLRTWDQNAARVILVRRYASMRALLSTRERQAGDEPLRALYERTNQHFTLTETRPVLLLPVAQAEGAREFGLVRIQRSRTTLGCQAKALQHARALARYVNETCPETSVDLYTSELGQEFGWVYWLWGYENPDTWRAVRQRLLDDSKYLELAAGAEGLFVDGSTNDAMWIIM